MTIALPDELLAPDDDALRAALSAELAALRGSRSAVVTDTARSIDAAETLIALGRISDALQELEAALERLKAGHGDHEALLPRMVYRRAQLLRFMGRTSESEHEFQRAESIVAPSHVDLGFERAELLAGWNLHQAGNHVDALGRTAGSLERLGLRVTGPAELYLADALKLWSEIALANGQRSVAYLALDDIERRFAQEAAGQLARVTARAMVARAWILGDVGYSQTAGETCLRASRLFDGEQVDSLERAEARITAGRWFLVAGDVRGARSAFDAVMGDADTPDAQRREAHHLRP